MDSGMISARYAKALLACAKECGDERPVCDAMSALADSFGQCPELAAVLKNPTLPQAQKKSLIATAAGGTNNALFGRLVDLLLKNGRTEELHRIALDYCDMYHADAKLCVWRVTTAYPMDQATADRIRSFLEKRSGRTVELKMRINPELLGGFVLDVDDERLDASVIGQLRRIKKKLAQSRTLKTN